MNSKKILFLTIALIISNYTLADLSFKIQIPQPTSITPFNSNNDSSDNEPVVSEWKQIITNEHMVVDQQYFSNDNSHFIVMQGDGNLVVYTSAGVPIWASGTHGNWNSVCILNNNGNMIIDNQSGQRIWETNTEGQIDTYSLEFSNSGAFRIVNSSNNVIWES